MDTHNDDQGNTNENNTNVNSISLSFEDLGRLTNQDPAKLKEKLLTTNAETGEPLSSKEQYDVLSGLMTLHFKDVALRNRNRGGKEILDTKQKQIASKYEVDASGTLDDVVSRIENVISTKASQDDKTAKRLQELQEKHDALKNVLANKDAEIAQVKDSYKKEAIFNTVKQRARTILKSENAMLSNNPETAERQLNAFFQTLKGHNYSVDGDTINVLDDQGNIMETEDFRTVNFKDFVMSKSFFDFGDKFQKQPTVPNGSKTPENTNHGGFVFTKEQKENYGSLYREYIREGNKEKAEAILKAGEEYFDKQNE